MRRLMSVLACFVVLLMITTASFAAETLAKKQELSFNVGTEPETLDPAKSTGVP